MDKAELLAKIDGAKQVIVEAEQDLARVLGALDQLPRADKQQISETIQKAFARLHVTRTDPQRAPRRRQGRQSANRVSASHE